MANDGIQFLIDQHGQVERLLDAVETGTGESRQASFDELRELLAVHETAEELILRPVTRKAVPGGEEIADARFGEENQAKDTLASLEKLDPASDEFTTMFAQFSADVRQHANNEETYEFPLVREHQNADELAAMSDQLDKAEKSAPTHPHPSARSTTANTVLGPFASLLDRARDAISSH